MTDPPAFLCDEMLGKLARWLRLAGYDAAYRKDVEDDELREEAASSGRLLLTRDAELAARCPDPPGSLRVEALDPQEQLAEVVASMDLPVDDDRVLTRCTVCNGGLEETGPDAVRDEVPGDVADEFDAFRRCTDCGKVYWPGSHVDAIEAVLADVDGA